MKLSEIIIKLEEIKEEHGDIVLNTAGDDIAWPAYNIAFDEELKAWIIY